MKPKNSTLTTRCGHTKGQITRMCRSNMWWHVHTKENVSGTYCSNTSPSCVLILLRGHVTKHVPGTFSCTHAFLHVLHVAMRLPVFAALQRFVQCLAGCCLVLNFRAQMTTNQRPTRICEVLRHQYGIYFYEGFPASSPGALDFVGDWQRGALWAPGTQRDASGRVLFGGKKGGSRRYFEGEVNAYLNNHEMAVTQLRQFTFLAKNTIKDI